MLPLNMDQNTYDYLHAQSIRNQDKILNSEKFGCFMCATVFVTNTVVDKLEFIEESDGTCTSLCPKCGIDSCIPTDNVTVLNEMCDRAWTPVNDRDLEKR